MLQVFGYCEQFLELYIHWFKPKDSSYIIIVALLTFQMIWQDKYIKKHNQTESIKQVL